MESNEGRGPAGDRNLILYNTDFAAGNKASNSKLPYHIQCKIIFFDIKNMQNE
jgi:hypothetical protein